MEGLIMLILAAILLRVLAKLPESMHDEWHDQDGK